MTTKKQTKTKKEKQATVIEPTHKNPDVLKDLYQKRKMSAGQIAKMFKVSRAAVLFQMKKHKIQITTRKTKSADAKSDYLNKTWLTAQLKNGVSIFKISKDQGVSYASVHRQAMKLVPAHICFVSEEFGQVVIFPKLWFAYNKTKQGDINEYQKEAIT